MKNPEKLIGKKVRGFRFNDKNLKIKYVKAMDNHIGEIGEIKLYAASLDAFRVDFDGCRWNYPADQIHEHLVDETQTKFPKVWAWDDDVNQAFETYLIAEFEGMLNEWNYLVVRANNICEFKDKDFFDTQFFQNISTTDPRLNDIITIVEK
jgi:hypothetical protein